jgi:hypothetical protein
MTRVHFKVLLHFFSNPSVKGMKISEYNKHDADAVLEFEKQALDIVSKDIRIQIKEIHQWIDGCTAQYP